MKIFISWSGELSQSVAMILRTWLKNVIQVVEPYVSSEDIEKGTRWFTEIDKHLEEAKIGIVCLTRENMTKPWILFEAGAISRSIDRPRVTPLLIDLSPADLSGPLAQFQAATVSESEMLRLVKSIGTWLADERFSQTFIESAFRKWWPDFRREIDEAIKATGTKSEPSTQRTDRAILEELLDTTRSIAQQASESREERISIPVDLPITAKRRDPVFARIVSGLLERKRRLLIAALDAAKTAYLEDDVLCVEFDQECKHYHDTLSKAENQRALLEVVQEVLGINVRIRLSVTRQLF